jgi:hypothetical protein
MHGAPHGQAKLSIAHTIRHYQREIIERENLC